MADRTFTDNTEPAVEAEWFTEANNLVHTLFNNPDSDKIGLAANGDFYVGLAAAPALFLDVSAYWLQIGKGVSTNDASISIGEGRTGDGNSIIDFIGDATYTDYGLRIIRNNSGANTDSAIRHRGTGSLVLEATDAGAVVFQTNNITRQTITSSGNTGFGINPPDTKVHIWEGSAGAVTAAANSLLTVENSADVFINLLSPNTATVGLIAGDPNDNDVASLVYNHSLDRWTIRAGAADGIIIDDDATAGNTRLLIYDVDSATLERVSVGIADSGGTNFKVLRIPN